VQLLLLAAMRRCARLLRAVGLAAVVDAVKRRVRPVAAPFTLDVHGLRMSGSSIGQLGQIRDWADGSKDGYMTEVFQSALEPGTAVVDVGAYLGYFTLLAARGVGGQGRVVAFEPHPDSRRALRENVAGNGVADRVVLVDKAIAATPGTRSFFLDAEDESESGLDPAREGARAVRVDCARGDDVLAEDDVLDERRVGVVKIDVEGREVEVLESLGATLAGSRPTLFVECNPEALARAGATAAGLLEAIAELGLDAYVINEDVRSLEPVPADVERLIEPGGYVNLFCRPSRGAQDRRPRGRSSAASERSARC
jgi:FkbM family methyltransferase